MKRKGIFSLATAETISRDPAAGRRALLTRVVRRRQRTCLVRLLVPAAELTGVVVQHANRGRGDVTRRLACMGRGLGKREPAVSCFGRGWWSKRWRHQRTTCAAGACVRLGRLAG
jgi:hypothetical protein